MNATKRSVGRAGLVGFSVLAVALTGCQTHVVHERTRTVYVPAPAPVVHVPHAPAPQPPVVYAPPMQSPVVVIQSETDFYEPLAAHGRWVVVGSYGRCWIPARVEAGWRPYSNGYWQRTDAGWYWASDEPWGWATYHYGRWDFHAQFGWIWVPQTQWAPAWVCWREGGGYVGWAPLRPSVRIGVNVHIGDYEPAFASRAFVFVEHRRMLEPVRPKTVIVNNTTIINNTVNITNVKIVNKTVINEGPRPEVIERASGRKAHTVSVNEFRRREETTVAARERNIRTARHGNTEPPARTERQPAERNTVSPPVTPQVEKPVVAVTPPSQPSVEPVRQSPRRPERARPTRDERKDEPEMRRTTTTTPPAVVSEPKPEVKSEQVVPQRREVRPVEKPAVASKRMPQSGTPIQAREERKRETVVEKRTTATPPAVESKPRQEARPEVRRETNVPAKVDAAPRPAVRKQAAPASQKQDEKPRMSPRGKSQAAERVEANKDKKRENGYGKDSEEQEAPVPQ